jgi:hypothetical protein
MNNLFCNRLPNFTLVLRINLDNGKFLNDISRIWEKDLKFIIQLFWCSHHPMWAPFILIQGMSVRILCWQNRPYCEKMERTQYSFKDRYCYNRGSYRKPYCHSGGPNHRLEPDHHTSTKDKGRDGEEDRPITMVEEPDDRKG